MTDWYYVGAYWPTRPETARACAHRAERFFHLLASCDSAFSRWFEKGWTLEEALEQQVSTSEADLLNTFLQEGAEEGRFPGQGFSLGLWNGQTDDAACDIHLYCGDNTRLANYCLLNLTREGVPPERVLQVPMLTRPLRAMVLAWEPDWAVVTSHEHRQQVSDSETGTFLGWLTYFSHRRGPVPPLPPPVRVEPLEDQGSLVLLTPERLSASHPSHLQLARDTASLLSASGLLSPVRPHDP